MLPYQTQCDVGLIIERGDFIRSFSIAKYWRNRYGPKALCFRVVRLSVCACVCTCIRVDAFSDRFAVDLQFIFAFYFFSTTQSIYYKQKDQSVTYIAVKYMTCNIVNAICVLLLIFHFALFRYFMQVSYTLLKYSYLLTYLEIACFAVFRVLQWVT